MNLSRQAWIPCLFLAACAASAPGWEKPGASAGAMEEDLQRCRVEARLAPQPRVGATPGSATGTSAMAQREERDAVEAQHVHKCMTGRGYSAGRR
jgi:hypothetical protein